MSKNQTPSTSISTSPSTQVEFSSETTLIQPDEKAKTSPPSYPEYQPISSDSSKYYNSKTIKAEKIVFKLR